MNEFVIAFVFLFLNGFVLILIRGVDPKWRKAVGGVGNMFFGIVLSALMFAFVIQLGFWVLRAAHFLG